MTVLNPKIEGGYVTGTAYDKYDYELMFGKNFKDVPKNVKDLNNKAYALQTFGRLKNYYVLVPIRVKI